MESVDYIRSVLDNPHSLLVTEEMRVRTYGKGRVCSHDGCTTVLSSYNPDDFCYLHDAGGAHDPAADEWWRCGECGDQFPAETTKRDGRCPPCYRAKERRRYARRVGHEPAPDRGRKRKD